MLEFCDHVLVLQIFLFENWLCSFISYSPNCGSVGATLRTTTGAAITYHYSNHTTPLTTTKNNYYNYYYPWTLLQDMNSPHSCVGVFKNGRVEIIANDQGNRMMPVLCCLFGKWGTSCTRCSKESSYNESFQHRL
jgi:hypothetical protein